MKKLLCVILCAAFLTGCTMIKENDAPVTAGPAGYEPSAEAGPGEINAGLYFLDAAEDKLVAEPRSITLDQQKDPAVTVMEELLKGPNQANLQAVATPGLLLDRIETSDKIVMVYVKTQGQLPSDMERFIFETAAADTLTDFLNASFVDVFWNGVSSGLFNEPTGPLSKYTGSLTDAYSKAESDAIVMTTDITKESKVALFFTAGDGEYILPEVRNIVFPGNDYIKTIIDELKKAPPYPSRNTSSLDKNTQLEKSEWIKEYGKTTLVLYFSELSQPSEFGDLESEVLTYASIVYTLTGFLPGVDNIRIFSDDEEVKGLPGFKDFPQGMTRSDFAALLGKSVDIYLTNKNSALLTGVTRTVAQSDQRNAKKRLLELMKGPSDTDGQAAWPIIPAGISRSDILDVSVANDTVTLNLSNSFQKNCAGLSEENETLLVYGIVNTMCEINGIHKVKFLIEGKGINILAGYLYMGNPLFKNPGLITN